MLYSLNIIEEIKTNYINSTELRSKQGFIWSACFSSCAE